MNFTDYIQTWAKGDLQQGKIMLAFGVLGLVIQFFIFKSDHSMLKGMMIPLSLLVLIFIGYGSFLTSTRMNHATTNIENYQNNPQEVLQTALKKANTDNKNYTALKPIWGILIVVSISLFFVFTKDDYKGLSLGLLVLFLSALITDSLLHHRLKPYLEFLNQLMKN
ncbi:MAG: hypothetical protein ACI8ZX_002801 [Planctomycetota bacterium]|jgi:hypothetical protein